MTNKTINIQTIQINAAGSLDATIGALLREIGVPASLQGYRATKEAVKAAVNDPTLLDAITKELYPQIAKTLGTTASRVARSIRHAAEVAFERGNREFHNVFFGSAFTSGNAKPTNSEFIATLAEYMNENCKAEFEPLVDVPNEGDTEADI